MNDEGFEWDAQKAARNWRDHGVSFQQAVGVFRDLFAIELVDDRDDYGEERINVTGMAGGVLLRVTFTERAGRIRIISARRAEKYEQDHYFRENSR